ncbi:uncharacterized protein LOC115559511 [Xyrichtys novacula]|uniref:Uncharacterized protein LOC115559511 n=1 Tax=Xyrichtys novacula TaxID=13765 RepID=A0AAV1HGN5_XYRNO|nr:uncharacterized protein LOC115559511 [Xyrichtys novacula]
MGTLTSVATVVPLGLLSPMPPAESRGGTGLTSCPNGVYGATNASLSGWGAVWQGRTAHGQWCPADRTNHINVLQLSEGGPEAASPESPESSSMGPKPGLRVLDTLCRAPFEPLEQVELKWLSCKTALLLAITSAKRVGEPHPLSISESCLWWNPDQSDITLWPNMDFLPKVPSAANINWPIMLARFDPLPGDGADQLKLLCPVRALRAYIGATAPMS